MPDTTPESPPVTAPAAGPVWAPRLSKWAHYAAVAAVVIAFVGLTLARFDLIPKLTGFMAFLGSGAVAAVALVLALLALLIGWRTGNPARTRALVAALVGVAFVGFLGTRPLAAGDAPPLHDISTDLADPPQFRQLELRPDNLAGVGTVENWRQMHAAAYGDIGPVTLAMPVDQATAVVAQAAEEEGWEVVVRDPAAGHIEATASVSYIRFKDDVVFRITPVGTNQSRVDMRSVSRVGVGDLGVNARRVRGFLARLTSA